jgi:hypothetical protein
MQKLFGIVFITTLLLSSCQWLDGKKNDVRIARVQNKFLYLSDLKGVVSAGTNAADSIAITERYIDNWVRQNLLLHEAEKNTTLEMADIQRRVNDYRNSLVIFNFENKLLSQMLDTIISQELLLEYYEKHKSEFKLRSNIVKVNFVKLPVDAPDVSLVRRLIRSEDANDIEKLEDYCINHAAGYFLEQDSWFLFTDILREIPLNPANHENFLRSNQYVELSDPFFLYFINIRDYRLEGSNSPLNYQVDNIKAIILNHRKQNMINQLRQDLYLNAIKESSFEVFNLSAY